MKLLIVAAAILACTQAAVMCPENACQDIDCDQQVSEEDCAANNGTLKSNGGMCGCCDLCVQQLAEGDDCTGTLSLGAPNTVECGGELFCDYDTKKCTNPACAIKKKEMEDFLKTELMAPPGMTMPECDDDGTYAGKQCSGSQCYCVDKNGGNLGYSHNRWETNDEILCQCARDKDAYMSQGMIGRMFRCTEHGDYHTVQCIGSVCYCADKKTGQRLENSEGVHITSQSELNC